MKDAPLIYPTLLKSAFFTVVLACFKFVEDAAIGLYRHQSFRQSNSEFAGGTWQGILTLASLVFVMLIPFVGFEELRRVMGEAEDCSHMKFGGHLDSLALAWKIGPGDSDSGSDGRPNPLEILISQE